MAIKALEQEPCGDCISRKRGNMTREERLEKLRHLITCMKCEVSGKCCDDNCPTRYDAGNMGEIIENLEEIAKALEQESCGNWYDVSSNEMTLEQARQAVKDLRKKLAERLEQEPCGDCISRENAIKQCGLGEKMITYISGPITGHDDYLEKFAAVESRLKREGHIPVNPAWIMEPFAKTNARHEDFMEACLRLMAHCEAIYMLDDWKDSQGAVIEYQKAQKMGLWIGFEEGRLSDEVQ